MDKETNISSNKHKKLKKITAERAISSTQKVALATIIHCLESTSTTRKEMTMIMAMAEVGNYCKFRRVIYNI